jgi:hypothetical protein
LLLTLKPVLCSFRNGVPLKLKKEPGRYNGTAVLFF